MKTIFLLLCLGALFCASIAWIVYDHNKQEKRKNPDMKRFIQEKNVDEIIRMIKEGCFLTSRDVIKICNYPEADVSKILLTFIENGQHLTRTAQWCILSLPEKITTEIFYQYAANNHTIEYDIVAEICRKFSRENARKICLELNNHRNFFHYWCPEAQKVVPEICSE